jgi:hypothetical protein
MHAASRLALGMILTLAPVAEALDISSCDSEVPAGQFGVLTADLDCSSNIEEGSYGVELGRNATLDVTADTGGSTTVLQVSGKIKVSKRHDERNPGTGCDPRLGHPDHEQRRYRPCRRSREPFPTRPERDLRSQPAVRKGRIRDWELGCLRERLTAVRATRRDRAPPPRAASMKS